MHTFLKIAWRNINRNKYRSIITISVISFGLTALIFIYSFVEGAHRQMLENYTNLVTGHIQIHKKGFHEKMGLSLSIEQPERIQSLLRENHKISFFSQRIKENVLVSSTEQSAGILLVGIQPEKEITLTKLDNYIYKGEFLNSQDYEGIILGKELAKALDVSLNDKVVIMAQAYDGSLSASAYRIKGLLKTGDELFDKNVAFVSLEAAEKLLVLEHRISEFVIKCISLDEVDRVAKDLNSKLGKDIEVLTWKEISPVILEWVNFDNAFIFVILIIFLGVVAGGILNTMLMATLERTREFGIMLALGTKRAKIVLMVTIESILLGLLSAFLGTLLGGVLSIYLGNRGIDLSLFSQAMESYYMMGAIIYPRLLLKNIIFSIIVVTLTSLISSIYPAWKAANLKPIEALRHS